MEYVLKTEIKHTDKNSATRTNFLLPLSYEFQWLRWLDVSHHRWTLALGFYPVLVQAQPRASSQQDFEATGSSRGKGSQVGYPSKCNLELGRAKLPTLDDPENFLGYSVFCICGINCVHFLGCVANFLLDCYSAFFGYFCRFLDRCEIRKTQSGRGNFESVQESFKCFCVGV